MIKRGAEADIWLGRWLHLPAIFKVRTPRPYMHERLDERTRKHRTYHEAQFVAESKKLGVPTPLVYHVNVGSFTIVMQYLPGPRLKELLACPTPRLYLCRSMGAHLATLHSHGVVHGDPTTSNFIFSDGKLAVIDFGLSYRTTLLEDIAVDLHLVKEVFSSAHADLSKDAMDEFKLGYATVAGLPKTERLWERARDIERRGRYARSEWGATS